MRRTQVLLFWLCGLTVFAAGVASPVGNAAGEAARVSPSEGATAASPAYGTTSSSALVVSMLDFAPPSSTTAWATYIGANVFRYQTSGPPSDWFHGVSLPNGALIERIEIHACDESASGQILFGMTRAEEPGTDGGNITGFGATGFFQTPGCGLFSISPTDPFVQVDNTGHSYVVFVSWEGDFSASLRVSTVRVYYRLQVSPAPALATFADVPTTHPYFRFIEALAAAGVTGGCGGGLYCPDSPVTRAQMAALLSLALGLHFPN